MLVIFQLMPVALAIAAVLYAAANYKHLRTPITQIINALGMSSALMLIIAQSAWFSANIDITGTHAPLAYYDIIWSVFNYCSMILVMLVTRTMIELEAHK